MAKTNVPAQYELLFRNALNNPLGRVGISDYIFNSAGVADNPMRILGSYAVVYVIEGGGHFLDGNGFSTPIRAGDLILIFPDVGHTYGPGKEGYWHEYHIVFDGPVFDLWRSNGLLNDATPIVHLEPVDFWTKRLSGVQESARSATGTESQIGFRQICALQKVLAEALTSQSTTNTQDDKAWVERARYLLSLVPESGASSAGHLHEAAREMQMSYESFRKKFTQLSGIPPGQFRQEQYMDRACEMLLMGSRNKEIAARLGFCDEYHFSRQFKKIVGTSPQGFRRALQQKQD